MSIVKTINDLESIYDDAVPIETNGQFQCPVCKKTLKTKKGMESHIEKRDCYDVRTLFEHTEHEKSALYLFKNVMAEFYPRARTDISSFRRNKSYSLFIKYVIFCALHEIKNRLLYFSWIRDVKGRKTIHGILSAAQDEGLMREYREWLMQNPSWIDSQTFLERYADDLMEDSHFMIRSLEKAHVTIQDVLSIEGLDLNTLPLDYRMRLDAIVEKSK